MRKKLFIIIVLLLSFCLTGCSIKRTITPEKFKSITKNYKLSSKDVSSHFKNVEQIKSVIVADSDDLWNIEFYVFKDNDSAKDMYKKNKKYYNENKTTAKSTDIHSTRNSDDFTVVGVESYMHVCRIKNTLVYVYAPIDYKVDVEKVIRALKY